MYGRAFISSNKAGGAFTFATLPAAAEMVSERQGTLAWTSDQGLVAWTGSAWSAQGGGAVVSVNSQTGVVSLHASDIFGATSDLGASGPNFLIGFSGGPTPNAIDPTTHSSTISGGGQTSFPNLIGASFTGTNGGPDDTYIAGTASYATIAGGYDNIVNGLAASVLSQHARLYTAVAHGSILGGSQHRIETGSYDIIAGGTLNVINGSSPTAAAILGGQSITITGGQYSAAVGGFTNTIAAQNACCIAGNNNSVTGQNASTIGADTGTASAPHAVVTGMKQLGYFPGGIHYGARVQSTPGDRGNLVAASSQQTADATLTSLSFYGGATQPTFPINTAAIGRALVIGRQSGTTNLVAYQCIFACHRGASGNVVVDSQTWTLVGVDGITIAGPPVINATNTVFRIQVLGKAATVIDWNSDIQLCTVSGA